MSTTGDAIAILLFPICNTHHTSKRIKAPAPSLQLRWDAEGSQVSQGTRTFTPAAPRSRSAAWPQCFLALPQAQSTPKQTSIYVSQPSLSNKRGYSYFSLFVIKSWMLITAVSIPFLFFRKLLT